MISSTGRLRKTPLYETHRRHGARMIDFAGWAMPVQYEGALSEHLAVRSAGGVFDVSHMGEIEVHGPDASACLQRLTCNDVEALSEGQAQYSALLYPSGTFVDDVVVYCFSATRYMLCVNASNREKDLQWILQNRTGDVQVSDQSEAYAQLAVQGPVSRQLLAEMAGPKVAELGYYRFLQERVAGHEALISRTGYTGEIGYELYVAPDAAGAVWEALFQTAAETGLRAAGLAARNTLRLEMSYALYGNDINDQTTVLEAGLGWIARLDSEEFIGREALLRQKESGPPRRLCGFEMQGREVPRDGYPVLLSGESVGRVTSGSYSPSLQRGIGLTYLPYEKAQPGREVEIEIRGRRAAARVVKTPFYKGTGPATGQ